MYKAFHMSYSTKRVYVLRYYALYIEFLDYLKSFQWLKSQGNDPCETIRCSPFKPTL